MHYITSIALLLIFTMLACAQESQPETPASKAAIMVDLDAERTDSLLHANEQIVILDVRTPGEYESGHLKDARNIDYRQDNFREKLAELDRDTPYLVHCASGGRSGRTLKMMKELAFSEVYHLATGMNGWKAAGKAVVMGEKKGE